MRATNASNDNRGQWVRDVSGAGDRSFVSRYSFSIYTALSEKQSMIHWLLDSPDSTPNSHNGMIARVTLEIALRKEFDYLIPPDLEKQVEAGTRVKVPFGPRQVMGCVTALVEHSPYANLRPISKIVGTSALVTPNVLKLARWIADYYCCPFEFALQSVLPEAVRKEKEGWRERLFVRALPLTGALPRLTKRQQEVWNIIEEWRELPLQELLELAQTTADTACKLEDKGLVSIGPKISERDPYANEHILPTQPLVLNAEQAVALEKIKGALNSPGSTRVPRVGSGVPPEVPLARAFKPVSELTVRQRNLPHFEIPGRTYHVTWRTQGELQLSPEARKKTLAAYHYWHGSKLRCHLACVMPDHVHLLIQPLPVREDPQ